MYPILSLFGFSFGTYGICCVIGGALAIWLAIRNGKRFQQDRFAMLEACVWAIIGSFLGAKLLYLLVSFSDIVKMFQTSGCNWDTISSLLEGGFVFYGGLLGGLAALLLYLHHFQLPYGVYLSSITPAVPLAHAFGRIGCFFAGCCYGIPYDPPIGICLKNAIWTAPTDIPLFPVQLLESGLDFLLAGLLQLCFRKRTRKTDVIPFYCIGYAGIRLFTERFRYDSERGIYFGLATSEWISLALAICGVLLLLVPSLRRKRASHS